MQKYKLFATATISALTASAFSIWLTSTPPIAEKTIIPSIIFSEKNEELTIWGAWDTTDGYKEPYTIAVEIRCTKEQMICVEGLGRLLKHDEGQDLEAEVFAYKVDDWSENKISAVATSLMAECLERRLSIDPRKKSAELSWKPISTCEGGNTGKAILIGDKSEL